MPLGPIPWMAKISGCSASVLNKRTILTAAHCVCNRAPSSVELPGSNTYIYPGYPTGSGCAVVRDYDLAVLKTSSDIAFNSNVQPIALFSAPSPAPAPAIISMGYGGDHNGISNVLNYAETTLTRSGCGSAYFCSSRQPNSIYFGDSGGPMVYRSGSTYYQLGVNSGISSTTSLYANVVRYASFINRYT
uniref:Peptidase S1 domain-containing protein n=1 Tax=Macrostomum lignano TaxID=282301 RepID=A0A1I8FU55_9PLAT